ncbi:MAG: hypothetical protein Q7R81_01220 [Candidatus Peregrinibacteria bacterium]|nr:hypothetical protein [Candidatus Peregrinibacteria bacterium]
MSIQRGDIIGHEQHLHELTQDLTNGNVAHAYLFAGPRHVGKFTVAKWFSQELLTHGLSPEDARAAVHQAERLIHRDLLILDQLWMEEVSEDLEVLARSTNVPQQHRMKARAKTNMISVEDVRALQRRLAEVVSSPFRCCLIRSVERMQDEAANALLKILEEPPEGVVFLLTTESLSSLLPTLISRSRVLRFTRVPYRQLKPLLEDVDEQDAQFILHVAQGAPGVVERLRDSDALRKERQQYNRALSFWNATSFAERIKGIEPLEKKSEEADQFLLHLALALRNRSPLPVKETRHLVRLLRGLKTNAQRNLLLQQFVLSVTGGS